MPKDEFDPEDPMELCGVGLVSDEDTTDTMAECFIEEFMRLGYNPKQILALFRNPFYIGVNMVLQNRGEPFVRERIVEVFARWGKAVTWSNQASIPLTPALSRGERENASPPVDHLAAASGSPTLESISPLPEGEGQGEGEQGALDLGVSESVQVIEIDPGATDPMGGAIPKLD
ncbi:MAG: hypothetical protein HYY23_05675 [Verrucomicrobia bacterium]|nr:hypothetical protein [Verrucomicrobiota bacterium]